MELKVLKAQITCTAKIHTDFENGKVLYENVSGLKKKVSVKCSQKKKRIERKKDMNTKFSRKESYTNEIQSDKIEIG